MSTEPSTAPDASAPLRKFMFDRSFDHDSSHVVPSRDRRPVTYTHEQLEALKKQLHEAGFAEGKKAAQEEMAQRLNIAVEKISATIQKLLENAAAERPQKESRIREAVLAIARKILPDFSQRNGLQEIEAVVAGVVGEMSTEPRLVVRVNEGQFDTIDANLKSVTEKQGYTGKIVLLADAEIKPNDCRVEWADGGIERNLDALWNNLGKTLAPETGIPAPPVNQEQAAPPSTTSDAAG